MLKLSRIVTIGWLVISLGLVGCSPSASDQSIPAEIATTQPVQTILTTTLAPVPTPTPIPAPTPTPAPLIDLSAAGLGGTHAAAGYVTPYGDQLLVSDHKPGEALMLANPDGTYIKAIKNGFFENVIVLDNYVFALDGLDHKQTPDYRTGLRLIAFTIDHPEQVIKFDVYSNQFIIHERYLYFLNFADQGKLYRGSIVNDRIVAEKISDRNIRSFSIANGQIFISEAISDTENYLRKISLNGEAIADSGELWLGGVHAYIFAEDCLYFTYSFSNKSKSGHGLARLGFNLVIDPTQKSIYTSQPVDEFVACGEYLYYKQTDSSGENYTLWRVKKDGSQMAQVSDNSLREFQIIGDKIFFRSCSGENEDKHCVMNLDGSGLIVPYDLQFN